MSSYQDADRSAYYLGTVSGRIKEGPGLHAILRPSRDGLLDAERAQTRTPAAARESRAVGHWLIRADIIPTVAPEHIRALAGSIVVVSSAETLLGLRDDWDGAAAPPVVHSRHPNRAIRTAPALDATPAPHST